MSERIEKPDGHTVIEVTYRLSDLYAVNWQSWRTWLKIFGWMILLFLVLTLFIPVSSGERVVDALAGIDVYLVIPLLLIILIIATVSPFASLWARKRQGWNVPMLVHADDEGITVDHPMGSVHTFWSAIKKVRATRTRLFLFTTPSCAYILPKRCFADAVIFQRWIEESERRWANASV